MSRQHFTRVQHQYTTRVYRVYAATTRVYSILHTWYTRVQHTTRMYMHGVMPSVLLCKLCACVTRVFCVSHACLLRVACVSSACRTCGPFKLWVICTVHIFIHINCSYIYIYIYMHIFIHIRTYVYIVQMKITHLHLNSLSD